MQTQAEQPLQPAQQPGRSPKARLRRPGSSAVGADDVAATLPSPPGLRLSKQQLDAAWQDGAEVCRACAWAGTAAEAAAHFLVSDPELHLHSL